MSGILNAVELLCGEIKESFERMSEQDLHSIDEIRLRAGKNITVTVGSKDLFVTDTGAVTNDISSGLISKESDIEYAFKAAFSYSLHSYSKELAMGYITTKGGNRVGICGTAVVSSNKYSDVDTVKYISSINIRISRQITGFADELCRRCFLNGLSSVLIIGTPSSGKTTLLRDTARILGDKHKLSIVDEQNEISATYRNKPQNDVGTLSDVFVGYPKHIGILTAIRVMSPKLLIVDEIGTEYECDALESAVHSGVKLITAVHGDSLEGTLKRKTLSRLIELGAFDYAAVLHEGFKYELIKLQ